MEQGKKERSLVSKVVDELVTGIVGGKYGKFLPPQDVLSTEFGVSRTVMREALSMLLARNMLDMRPKIGTRIRPMGDWRMIDEEVVNWRCRANPDPQFLRDLNEFRLLIVPRASAQAAARASAKDIAAIREALEALRAIRPTAANYLAAKELFDTRIVVASGNQLFGQMAAIVRCALPAAHRYGSDKKGGWEEELRLYERLVEAIERHDAEEAAVAALALIEYPSEASAKGGKSQSQRGAARTRSMALA